MYEQPLVSIITPTYNCSKFIRDVYESIVNQEYKHWEWVVTDDNSTDDTFTVLRDLANKDDRIVLSKTDINSGAAVCRNNSIELSSGRFLAFIDGDDLWLPNKLTTQIKFMLENRVSFSFTAYQLVNVSGDLSSKVVDLNQKLPLSYQDMLRKKATLGCSTVMLDKTAFNDISLPNLRTGQDYALWLNLLRTGENAHPIPIVLTYYRITPNSISRNKFKKAIRQWQIYRKIEKIDFFNSIPLFFNYAWRACFESNFVFFLY
ncbi:glycosyl transferase family 2 [Veronia nyctiphanis]|uniref:Glycosyl transferase family 2 n=1 Tax=Veronia nyctiphanis TaxID=1278244 RepID=A0A4Q0YWP2_9GAMM|nr:glycosyltransferase family 2 protein [Veronia nyctiphanis]RXJ74694.1 glycosyl transferase family 2 [Veronia nyctiphanis]